MTNGFPEHRTSDRRVQRGDELHRTREESGARHLDVERCDQRDQGCERTGVRRLVFQSGILMSDGRELSLVNRLAARALQFVSRPQFETRRSRKPQSDEVASTG